jgi:hypothetical protein
MITILKVFVIAVGIVIIGASFVIPINTQEFYETNETYYEIEPHTSIETYYEIEPYTDSMPLTYTTFNFHSINYPLKNEFDIAVTVKNTDSVRGEFWVNFHAENCAEGSYNFTSYPVVLMPGESYPFIHIFNGTCYGVRSYEVYSTTKEVTKYRDVPKQRTITLWKDVPKETMVLKVRTVKKPIYQIIMKNF